MRQSLRRARQVRPRVGARLDQRAGELTSSQSEMVRLQRLVGNSVVAKLIAGARVQRRTDSTGGGGGSSVGVRNEATFPASLQVVGALLSLGETTIGGSTTAGSLSASETVDVGGSVVVSGPIKVGSISAPVIVKQGPPAASQNGDASDRVARAFDEGEAVPRSGGSAPTPSGGFSTGEATPGGAISAGEATPSSGLSEGEAPANNSTAADERPAPESSSSFVALVVRQSLTVAGNLAAGSARLGSPATIGGSLQVGALRAATLRAGGTVVLKGPTDVDQTSAGTIVDNAARVNAGSSSSSLGSEDSDNAA